MTLTAYDPNDTGEILADGGLSPAVAETARITYDDLDDPTESIVGEGTRRMPRFLADAPISPLPLDCVPRHANTDDQWLVPAVLTGAEATVLRTAIPPQPGQPNPHPQPGPTSPVPSPPIPDATDDKPPPGTEPPKPAPTPSRLVDGILGVPVLRPAVPEYVGRHRTVRLGWGYWLATGALALVCGAAGGGAVLLWAVTW
jgi:hypothetical protein